ncbi:MAG: twin-arginine translocase TatA/TatE family subunit [Deltaproteobacteria bacterium]|nr:twin-arginine translocase TatA/TatE family subunit [Deltaproteobacteria bacterium]
MRPGLTEILLILAIALLLFGAGRLADIGKGLGEGIRNFRRGLRGDEPKALPRAKDKAPAPAEKDEEA